MVVGMSQRLADKIEALKTLLPLVGIYLARMPEARTVPRYGDSEQIPGPPPPGWSLLDCNGRCSLCVYSRECRGEWWEVEARSLERKYRVLTIRATLARLELVQADLWRAVWTEYVEDHDPTLVVTGRGERWARAELGVRWIARNIRGDLCPYYEIPKTATQKILELLDQGVVSSGLIADRIQISRRRVDQIKARLRDEYLEAVSSS
jgi:hypothetical protein